MKNHIMENNRPRRNFKRREPSLSIEERVEQFVLRNSNNGYFTKVSTISFKFGVSEDETWRIVGEILAGGKFETMHDKSGEMKICEIGKTYSIMGLEKKRRYEKYKESNKKPTKK